MRTVFPKILLVFGGFHLIGRIFPKVKGMEITEKKFKKMKADVIDCDKKMTYQNLHSSIQCSSLCLSNDKCDAYQFSNKVCSVYETVKELTENSASNIYITPDMPGLTTVPSNIPTTTETIIPPTTTETIIPPTTTETIIPPTTTETIIPPTTTETIIPPTTTVKSEKTILQENGYVLQDGRWTKRGEKMKWLEALEECQQPLEGGHLFIVKSREDAQFLINTTEKDYEFWIGLNDSEHEEHSDFGEWQWIDGSILKNDLSGLLKVDHDSKDDDFARAKNKKDKDHLEIHFKKADEERHFICEYKPNSRR